MADLIFTGQNITKDSVIGDKLMDRYGIFNGLERPRRIDKNENTTILGVEAAPTPSSAIVSGAGSLVANWYAWVAVYASSVYTRPVPVADGSGNYTRGNPSATPISFQIIGAARQIDVTVPAIDQDGITHVLLYRSLGAATQDDALAGPFFYVAQGLNTGVSVVITDNIADANVGAEVERDNFPPNAYRYGIETDSYLFVGGNFPIGEGITCTVTPGSSQVTADTGAPFYDGIIGWLFKCTEDSSGGVDGGGLYYANYVDGSTLELIDAAGNTVNYDGSLSGAGQEFLVYLAGYVLRWCKKGEPESWRTEDLIPFEGDITGIAQIPNQPLILVCTDEPTMWILDLNRIGTESFKQNKLLLSNEYTASSHYSLVSVDGRLRGIDAHKNCIWETDGSVVVDISSSFIPEIFKYLSKDQNQIKLWHCAYDQRQHFFGAFVTFANSQRLIDFSIQQFTITGSWYFNLEKDLLCTGNFLDNETGEAIVLGGTEGPGGDLGGVWGRIWTPNVYSDWIPEETLLSGTITNVVDSTTFDVDVSTDTLYSQGDGLIGRWVMICDEAGEYAQVGYIISNTSSRITVNRVIGGLSALSFYPPPQVGWQFYLGLIEMRWGPKRYDFGDPDVLKKVWEVWFTVYNHDEDKPPFIRLYRGYDIGYAEQLTLEEREYLDKTVNQSFVNKVDNKLEAVPRWGIALYDRSYEPTTLHSMTLVFNPVQNMGRKMT